LRKKNFLTAKYVKYAKKVPLSRISRFSLFSILAWFLTFHVFCGRRLPGKQAVFEFVPNKSVIPNYYYFYLDDAEWGESFNCAPKEDTRARASPSADSP
jgi:hypothetical protein